MFCFCLWKMVMDALFLPTCLIFLSTHGLVSVSNSGALMCSWMQTWGSGIYRAGAEGWPRKDSKCVVLLKSGR